MPGPDAGPRASVRGEITLVIDLGMPIGAEIARPDSDAAATALLARGLYDGMRRPRSTCASACRAARRSA